MKIYNELSDLDWWWGFRYSEDVFLTDMSILLYRKIISMNIEKDKSIGKIRKYLEKNPSELDKIPKDYTDKTIKHSELKYIMYELLKEKFGKEADFEKNIVDLYVSDLYLKEKNICVECGFTSAKKIYETLLKNKEIWWLTYDFYLNDKIIKFKVNDLKKFREKFEKMRMKRMLQAVKNADKAFEEL